VAPDPWVTRFDGSFLAQPIPPGRVRALVRHPGYVEALSEAVTLAPGGKGSVKVVLSPGGALEGRVVDAHGIPVAGVRVDAVAVVGTVQRSTITSTDGTFAFAAIPREITIAIARPEDLSRIVHREVVKVPEGESVEVEVVLGEPRGEMAIVVESEGGAPIPMAQVSALSLDTASPLRETRFTDAEGKVAIPDAQGLAIRLIVEATGYARSERVLPAAPESLTLSLVEGVLVEGSVTAVRGRNPVASAVVTLAAGGQSKSARTDDEGRYVFRDVSPGKAQLRVTHPDYAEVEAEIAVRATGRADRPFEVAPVDLVEAGSVSGVVLDASGKPVSGARVAIGMVPAYLPLGALPPGMSKTNASGKFVIEGVHPGMVAIEAYAVDVGRGHADRVVVEAGRPTENVEIRLTERADDTESAAPATVAITLADRVSGGYVETVIVHVAAGSEAERGGLARGDVLLEVDGVEPDSLDKARQLLSGMEGSDVVAIVERKGVEVPLRIRRERVRR
jgi:protocatechuate 3,4-dioxygenase beta subunit